VTDTATASLEEATALIQDLRAGKGTLGRLFTDEQLYRELTTLVTSAEAVAKFAWQAVENAEQREAERRV